MAIWVKTSQGVSREVGDMWVNNSAGDQRHVIAAWVKTSQGVARQWWPETMLETFVYYMDWAQSYSGSSINNSSNRDKLNYEGKSDFHGQESSLWGFDDAQMRSDLAGKTILSVDVRLTSRWSFGAGGKNFNVMQHNYSSKPSSMSPGSVIYHGLWARGETRAVALPVSFAEGLRDGTQRGLGLRYTDPSDNGWGYMTGTYSTNTLTASPSSSQLIPCPTSEKAMITVRAQ
jgi:hypothetical protein